MPIERAEKNRASFSNAVKPTEEQTNVVDLRTGLAIRLAQKTATTVKKPSALEIARQMTEKPVSLPEGQGPLQEQFWGVFFNPIQMEQPQQKGQLLIMSDEERHELREHQLTVQRAQIMHPNR